MKMHFSALLPSSLSCIIQEFLFFHENHENHEKSDFHEKFEKEQKVRLFAKKRTFPARGGNPSIAQHILMVLGAQMAQSALWGKKCGACENVEIS